MTSRRVRVSVASCWQRFHGCEPEYIRTVCHGKCCDAPTRPTGTLITIHPSEEAAIRARGAEVHDGLLVSPDRVCPFKTEDHLCSLHETGDKPYGCIASPFTLNKDDCLIVRNRYRMLRCYAKAPRQTADPSGWPPAYVAFRSSLDLIFGRTEARNLVRLLDEWGDPAELHYEGPTMWVAYMPLESYRRLHENDDIKKGVSS